MKQWSYFVLTAVIKEKTTESSNTICRKGLLHRCVSFLNILKSFKTTRLIKLRISEREHNVFLLETQDVSHLRDSYIHSRTDINTRENREVFEFLMPN